MVMQTGDASRRRSTEDLLAHAHMVYLHFKRDMDTIMDYIIDAVAGSPSRNRVVNSNVCMHVDDLILTGTKDFLGSFAQSLKKTIQIGSLDTNDVMFCGHRIIKQRLTVIVHQDLCLITLMKL